MNPVLVMLHGANGTGASLQPLSAPLRAFAQVETPNAIGHGGRPVPECFTVEEAAEDVVAFMDERGIERAFLFGYSSGGYTALYVARHHPQRVLGVCTLATKFIFDERTVAHLTHLTDLGRLKRPDSKRLVEIAREHHPQDWKHVTLNNRALFVELGRKPALVADDLRAIEQPALVICSDKDQIVPLSEAREMADLLRGRLLVFAGVSHPLGVVPADALAKAIGAWIEEHAIA